MEKTPANHGDGCDDAMDHAMDESTPYLVEFVTDERGQRVMRKVPNPDYVQAPRPVLPKS